MTAVVQSSLPPEGLEALQDRNWHPLVNICLLQIHTQRTQGSASEVDPTIFPLRGALFAPNSQEFLASLGRPLGVARELEANPGVWWLVDQDNQVEWIIWSDAHRKNSWKGGQICVRSMVPDVTVTADHPGVIALQSELARQWGLPDPGCSENLLMWGMWFKDRAEQGEIPSWPANRPVRSTRKASP